MSVFCTWVLKSMGFGIRMNYIRIRPSIKNRIRIRPSRKTGFRSDPWIATKKRILIRYFDKNGYGSDPFPNTDRPNRPDLTAAHNHLKKQPNIVIPHQSFGFDRQEKSGLDSTQGKQPESGFWFDLFPITDPDTTFSEKTDPDPTFLTKKRPTKTPGSKRNTRIRIGATI